MKFNYIENNKSVEEFNFLTEQVGWGRREDNIVREALDNTLYSISIYIDNQIVGYGRLIGDATIFIYIQDVMVLPAYQNKKIGTEIMNKLLEKIASYQKINPNLRAYLGADLNKEDFYRRFGFITRKEANLGEGMILKRDKTI